jgi:ABC-2 type transport system permease protein
MGRVLLLTRREVGAYFVTPVAYVVMAIFLFFASIFFAGLDFRDGAEAAMKIAFPAMAVVLAFLVPLLTMRTLAEEKYTGTIESLLTTPITDAQVVAAKFLGCWIIYALILLPTLVFPILLKTYGNPDLRQVATGYLGMLLVGALYVAVGLAASSLTKYQIVSAVVGIVVLVMAWLVSFLLSLMAESLAYLKINIDTVLQMSIWWQFKDFRDGKVDLVHVIYFAAVTLFMLFFTVKVLESRKWR